MRPGELGIKILFDDDRHTVVLAGEMDMATAPALERAVTELCTDGARGLVLDLRELEFMDSSGFRALLVARSLCEKAECDFRIAPEAQSQVERLFAIAGAIEPLAFARREQSPGSDPTAAPHEAEPRPS